MKQLKAILLIGCLLLVHLGFAQTRIVSGTVSDQETRKPIPGATVTVPSTRIATMTDGSGRFTISVPTNSNSIQVTSVGYSPKVISVSNLRGERLDIYLESSNNVLDEVVVTGGGLVAKRKEVGNASTTIKSEVITQGKSSNFASALSGKVPGLQVNAVNGGVNPNYRLVLRGQRSITGNNQALLVLDNIIVPNSMLGNLNPEDIENIEVLNGAGAAAAYGSDASNGAIVITTKRGKAGVTTIKASHTSTVEAVSYLPQIQNRFGSGTTPDAVKTYTPFENQQYGPEFDGSMVEIGKPLFDGSIQTIPYSARNDKYEFWQNGLANQSDISLTSGDDKSTYYISGQFFAQSGVLPKDKYKRASIRANGSRNIYSNFRANYNANYIQNWYDLTTASGSMYNEILQTPAHVPLTQYSDWKNDPYANPNGYYNDYYDNPYFSLDNWRSKTRNEYFQGNVQLEWNPIKNASVTYRIGISSQNAQNKSYNGAFRFTEYTKNISSSKGDYAANVSDSKSTSIQLLSEVALGYKGNITSDITYNLTALGSLRENNYKGLSVGGANLVIDDLFNIGNSSLNPTADESNTRSRQVALAGDARFGYKDFLFLHFTGRNDWRSILAKEFRSFFYPSVDFSFIASDAIPALKAQKWMTSLKIRGGYAYVGNVNLSPYALSTTFGQASGYPYNGVSAFTIGGTMVADDLKPEITKGPEAGFDLEMYNGRVSVGTTWYKTNTFNQTFSVSVSQASGYSSLRTNVGEVSNEGIESYLRVTPVSNLNGWTLTLGTNYAYNKNKVISLSDQSDIFVLDAGTGNRIVAKVGNPFPYLEVTKYNRDDQGRIIVNPNSGFPSFDGTNYAGVGITNPPHIFGADMELRYKRFRFTSLFEYRTGHFIANRVTTAFDFSGSGIRTTWFNRERFVIPNSSYLDPATNQYVENTNITTRTGGADFWTSGNYNTGVGENYVHSAAFWKWREATLSYDVPPTLLKGFAKGATISVQGRNLLLFVPKTNLYTDPEYSSAGSTSNAVGFATISLTPPARYFGGTISVNF